MVGKVRFWFEFASSYSYLSAMRVGAEADKRGVHVEWTPFLLGPIFAAQGWNTSPFKIYPAKGANMWRDMERRSEKLGLAFKRPPEDQEDLFPQHSVLAARVATHGLNSGWGETFVREVYKAEWGDNALISDPDVVARCVAEAGGDAEQALAAASTQAVKDALRVNTEAAIAAGVFGAPSFTVGDELFWGDDRLEDALDWAVEHA